MEGYRYKVPALIFKTGRYVIHHSGLGIIRSLGALGVPVYTVIENRFAPTALSRYLTGTFVWETRGLTSQQLLGGLEAIGRRLKQPTVLIPTDDLASILIAKESAALQQWFIFPKLQSNVPRTLANKKLLFRLCKEIRAPHPEALFPKSIDDLRGFVGRVTFPVVLKVACGWLKTGEAATTRIVRSSEELLAIYEQIEPDQLSNLFLQEYIPNGEDWFFHGYCNARSECLAAFTGMKLRSYPPYAGSTALGLSVSNETLLGQAETLMKTINYAGTMDIDYRFDRRDGQYKILDFNPRIGAQFKLFKNCQGIDLAMATYLDLTGQPVRRLPQIDGRRFIVEFEDLRVSIHALRHNELTIRDWCRSLKGIKELAWFKWNDPAPFIVLVFFTCVRGIVKVARLAAGHVTRWRRPQLS